MDTLPNKFNVQSLVNWIKKHPDLVVRLQKNLTQETCSMLDAKLKVFRMGQGIITRFDELEKNTQIANTIQYLCEHNFLYFLELIHRFDLIREIFKDNESFANELRLIEELERRYEYMQRKQTWLLTQQANEKAIQSAKPTTESNTHDSLAFNNNYADLLLCYERKMTQIHSVYHEQQIESHQVAATNYMNTLNETTKILHKNGHIDDQKKKDLDEQLESLEQERQDIDKMPTHTLQFKADKDARYAQYTEKLNLLCKSLHYEHAHVEELSPLREHRDKTERAHLREQQQNREQRDSELAKIKPHLEMTKEKTKESVLKNMDSLIKLVEEMNPSHLSKEEQKQFEQAYQQLNTEKARFASSTTYDSIRESHSKFSENLEKIERLLKPSMLTEQQHRNLKHEKYILGSFNFPEIEVKAAVNNQATPSENINLPNPQDKKSSQEMRSERHENNQENSTHNTQKFRSQVQEVRLQAKDPKMKELYTTISNQINQLQNALEEQEPGADLSKLNDEDPGSNQENINEQEPGSDKDIIKDERRRIIKLIGQLKELQQHDKISELSEDLLFSIDDKATELVSINEDFRTLASEITEAVMAIIEEKDTLIEEPSVERSYGL